MSDLVPVKLLDRVLHQGRVRHAGDTIHLEAEAAERLVELGIAEAESAAKKVLRKATGKSSGDGDGDGSKSGE